jgi:hypothetical protein
MKLPLIVVTLGTCIGLGAGEVAYRVKLCCLQSESKPSYIVASDVTYQFNQQYGYDYIPNMRTDMAIISKGYPVLCGRGTVNALGNFGLLRGSDEDAQIKILVFGDSFTSTVHDGGAWPDLLQVELQAEFPNVTTNVIGFGRDAIGVLQEFDMAAALIPKYKPAFAIIAFITDDLTRARFWRSVKVVNGEKRLFTTTSLSEEPDMAQAVDAHMINRRVTKEWCDSMLRSSQPGDPILKELNEQYRRLERDYVPAVNYFSPATSFLYNRLVHKDPVRAFSPRIKRPKLRVDYDSYEQDSAFKDKIDALRQLGIPYYLIHLPNYEELKAGKYLLSEQEQSLLISLRRLTGKHEIGLIDYYNDVKVDASRLFMLPHDNHPSAEGNHFYAQGVSNALVQDGLVLKPIHNMARSRQLTH